MSKETDEITELIRLCQEARIEMQKLITERNALQALISSATEPTAAISKTWNVEETPHNQIDLWFRNYFGLPIPGEV